MSEKVVLPKEVAEAIEELRVEGVRNFYIMTRAKGAIFSEPDLVLKAWAFDGDGEGSTDLLMQALVNGYETENSAEENVREYYEDYETTTEEALVIRKTLKLLGIKIEGVNA